MFAKGDRLVSIDGVDVRGRRVEGVKEMILGKPGSTIDIGFVPAKVCVCVRERERERSACPVFNCL